MQELLPWQHWCFGGRRTAWLANWALVLCRLAGRILRKLCTTTAGRCSTSDRGSKCRRTLKRSASGITREMEYLERPSFTEINRSLVSLSHFMIVTFFWFFISTQQLNTWKMPMDVVFVLKWVKSIILWALYILHLSGNNVVTL